MLMKRKLDLEYYQAASLCIIAGDVCRKESAKLMSQLSQLSFEELEGQR